MLLKKTSSSWSLSKSAAMTVRTGDGMENLGVAMSCAGDGHGVTMGMGSWTPGPALVLFVPSSLGIGAQSQIRVKLAPLAKEAQWQSRQWRCPSPSPHPESDAPRGPTLQVEAVRPVPVAIDYVHPAIAVEVSQRHATSVLVRVIQPWGAARGWGEPQGDGGSRDPLPASVSPGCLLGCAPQPPDRSSLHRAASLR